MRARPTLALAAIFLAVFVYEGVLRPLAAPFVQLPNVPGGLDVLTVVLMLFSLCHALYALGARQALVFLALAAAISWAYEQVGVETGLVYGRYHYTDVLGVKLGHVPLLIPIAWFMMIYPSYVIANLIAGGPALGSHGSVGRIAWLALLSAMVMTAWDLVVDPILSGPNVRAWVWEEGGPYFGIPVQNYIGWMLTTFTVYLAYRFYERRQEGRNAPAGSTSTAVTAMPVLAYVAMLFSNLLSGGAPDALRVIGPFVMGLPALAALGRLTHPQRQASRSSTG
jgi:putative membrane protein